MANNDLMIVNSDDFGYSVGINEAIIAGYEMGVISSATLMATMPGFEHAVENIHAKPILQNTIGLHLNLTEGIPMTDEMKKCKRFCNAEGWYIFNRNPPLFTTTSDEKKALRAEIKAQMGKLVKHGVIPTHIDAHHHSHTEFGVIHIYIDIAKEFGIKKVRLSKNLGIMSTPIKMYKMAFNTMIKHYHAMATTQYFCNANEYLKLRNENKLPKGTYEVMVHAKPGPDGLVVDFDNVGLEAKMRDLIGDRKLSSFYQL
jgi:predicted glycoside hydrolase/deacetylase ChbG (UPF0249 family)